MKPFIVLLVTFLIAFLTFYFIRGEYCVALSARIAMAAMLLFTSIGHFAFAKGMTMMLPDFIPAKTAVVYFTGIIEIAGAAGLLIPSLCVLTGWLLIVFFVLTLPANIYASQKKVDYQKGTHDGKGMKYLWFRIPLQLFFIAWVYFSAVRF